ncbi:hypothetical protein GZL_01295 [Streptomyces sp. 769]|nr:hypothetical protein GZL_01295 [Streptomyces sp. 769]
MDRGGNQGGGAVPCGSSGVVWEIRWLVIARTLAGVPIR